MPIFLDRMTRTYLERLFGKLSDDSPDFNGLRFKKMLAADRERLEKQQQCEHVEGTYTGHKKCCAKCGANYLPGHFHEWTLDKD